MLENGVYLKGAGRKRVKAVYTEEDLYNFYKKFEEERIRKNEKQLGNGVKLKPDSYAKFIVDRTDLCPHKLVSPNTSYWLDTIAMLEGEMGIGLPAPMDECPGIFFDALGVVRNARATVRKEETRA